MRRAEVEDDAALVRVQVVYQRPEQRRIKPYRLDSFMSPAAISDCATAITRYATHLQVCTQPTDSRASAPPFPLRRTALAARYARRWPFALTGIQHFDFR